MRHVGEEDKIVAFQSLQQRVMLECNDLSSAGHGGYPQDFGTIAVIVVLAQYEGQCNSLHANLPSV